MSSSVFLTTLFHSFVKSFFFEVNKNAKKNHLSVGFPKNMHEKIALLDMKNETLYIQDYEKKKKIHEGCSNL